MSNRAKHKKLIVNAAYGERTNAVVCFIAQYNGKRVHDVSIGGLAEKSLLSGISPKREISLEDLDGRDINKKFLEHYVYFHNFVFNRLSQEG